LGNGFGITEVGYEFGGRYYRAEVGGGALDGGAQRLQFVFTRVPEACGKEGLVSGLNCSWVNISDK
jgi:hypothetical protein